MSEYNYNQLDFSVNYEGCHPYPEHEIEYLYYLYPEYEELFKRYFEAELTGKTKNIQKFLDNKISLIENTLPIFKSSRMNKNKIRNVYKIKKKLHKTRKEKKEMENTLNQICQHFAFIVDICSTYGLKINEKYQNNLNNSPMLHQIQLEEKHKIEDENNQKYYDVQKSVKKSYITMMKCINKLSTYSVCVEYDSKIIELPYRELNCNILNKILNNRIAQNIANKKTQKSNKQLETEQKTMTNNKTSEVELKNVPKPIKQTLMEQYLNEKMNKTPDSSLTFDEYAKKYATLSDQKQVNRQPEESERTQKHGRKL